MEILFILVGIIVLIVLTIWGKRHLKLDSINIGPIHTEIKEVSAEKIEFLSAPIAGCSGYANFIFYRNKKRHR